MKIEDLDPRDRPRERAKRYGLRTLENAEIIALIVGNGVAGCSALEMARNLLSHLSFRQLADLDYYKLRKEKGFGTSQTWRLLACLELIRRFSVYQEETVKVKEISSLAHKYQQEIGGLEQEVLIILMMNRQRHIIHEEVVFKGTHQELIVSPTDLLAILLKEQAKCYLLIHNHPSGSLEPSFADLQTTEKMKELSRPFGILLWDHLIVTKENYYSFRENHII